MNTRSNMSSILLESRNDSEPRVASLLHDCTRELMEATNVIDIRAKESEGVIKAAVESNIAKIDQAKKGAMEKRKKEVDLSAAKVTEAGSNLGIQSTAFQALITDVEETRVNLRQALTAKESLAEGVIDSVASRDLEKKICAKKKLIVDDYLDAVEKAAAVYRTHLGLSLDRNSNGNLEMTFTRIDPRSLSRPFSLVLHLHSESKLYSFVSSSPSLDFQSLVNMLNRTNNMKKFVCRVRRTFVENLKH